MDKDPPPPVTIERTIYLPYEDLEEIFEEDGRGVFLPYKEFTELWDELNLKRKEEKQKPPAEGVVKSATYQARVQGENGHEVLVIDALVELESFKEEGWATVPLGKANLSIAESDTGEARLRLGPKGYEVLLPEPGRYELKLKLFVKIERNEGERTVKLSLPRAPVSKFEAQIPETGWDFELANGIAFTTSNQAGGTKLEFFFGQRDSIEATWRKESEETSLGALLFADTVVRSRVIPGAMQTGVTINYRILRAGVDSFEILVPRPHEVLSVDGSNIKEWTVTGEEQNQKLKVTLHAAARKDYQLELTLETGLETLPVDIQVPAIQTLSAVRQSGSVSLVAASELEVQINNTAGLTQQATMAAASNGVEMPLGNYRFLKTPYQMALNIKRAAPVIQVESYATVTVEPDVVELQTRFDYEVKRVGIFETALTMPAGYEGIDVTGNIVEDFNVEGNQVQVRFRQQQLGKFSFSLSARTIRAEEEAQLQVPVFQIADADRHDGKVGLAIHTSLEPTTTQQGGLRPEEVRALRDQLAVKNPVATPLTLGFAYRGQAAPAQIDFRQKESQVSATVRTLVDIQEQAIRYRWWISYDILYAGVDELILKIPSSIAGDLRVENSRYKEIDKNYQLPDADPPAADAEEVYWAVRLLDKQLGSYQIELSLDVTNTTIQPGAPVEVTFPGIALENVFHEDGQIAISKGANLDLGEETKTGLETIDPRELSGELRRGGIIKAFKYRHHPIALTVPVSKNDFMSVPKIVVTYADVTSVVSGDAGITTEVVYWVRNNAEPSLRVKLPQGAKLLSDVFVHQETQLPMSRAGSDDVYIRLPASAEARNQSFPVRFVYEVPSPDQGKKLPSSGLEIPAAELTNADVLQSRVSLYLPASYRYTNFSGPMQRTVEERGWRNLRNSLDFLIPALGPKMEPGAVADWKEPPSLSEEASAGFNVPMVREGRQFQLFRLGRPVAISIDYRSEDAGNGLEFLLGFIAFVLGVLLTGRSLQVKFLYFIFVGLLSLGIAGLAPPHNADLFHSIFLGVLFAVAVWALAGIWWMIRPHPHPDTVPAAAGAGSGAVIVNAPHAERVDEPPPPQKMTLNLDIPDEEETEEGEEKESPDTDSGVDSSLSQEEEKPAKSDQGKKDKDKGKSDKDDPKKGE